MEEITDILKEEDKETQPERHDEMRAMKNEIEAHLKEIMQEKMNELELKVDNKMDQLTKDLDAQSKRLTNCEMQLKEGVSDMKMMPMLEEMRGEFEKMKLEQTRLALKAKEDSEAMYTVKGRADAFIQLLEQKDEKMIKELNEHKTNMNTMMDAYKSQLEELKTTIASVDKDWGKEPRAMEEMESKIFDMMKDQFEWLGIMKQLRKDERSREMEQTKLNGNESVQKMEKMEAQINKDVDELRLNVDNQMTFIKKQLETMENRVTGNENKLAAFDIKVTITGNEVATIAKRVTSDDNEMTTINNSLATIENKVDANDNRITNTDKKVDAIDKRITNIDKMVEVIDNQITYVSDKEVTDINNSLATIKNKVDASDNRITKTDKKVDAIDKRITNIDKLVEIIDSEITYVADKEVTDINNRLTWMESWQKKHLNIGLFGSLRQIDGCQVSEFIFTVKNIDREISTANYSNNFNHYVGSEPFYTDYMGYCIKLLVYPNDSNTKHLGVYLSLIEGEFDAIVSWPFKYKYELHSVSRDGTQIAYYSVKPSNFKSGHEAFNRPSSIKSKGCGTGKYISSEKLLANKDQYVIDGGFIIKATIWLIA